MKSNLIELAPMAPTINLIELLVYLCLEFEMLFSSAALSALALGTCSKRSKYMTKTKTICI